MAEWRHLITEWLSEYASLQENEIKSFAAEHEHNHEIATALFNLFYSEDEGEPSTNKHQNENLDEVFDFMDSFIKVGLSKGFMSYGWFFVFVSFDKENTDRKNTRIIKYSIGKS